jgi:Bromodomain
VYVLITNRGGKAATKNTELSIMNRLLSEMQNHASSWPFREPVKLSDAADYYDVIEQPMGALFFSFYQKLRMTFFAAQI